jgi:hypothetical protein
MVDIPLQVGWWGWIEVGVASIEPIQVPGKPPPSIYKFILRVGRMLETDIAAISI